MKLWEVLFGYNLGKTTKPRRFPEGKAEVTSKSEMKRTAVQNPDALIQKILQLEEKLAIAVEALGVISGYPDIRAQTLDAEYSIRHRTFQKKAREALEKIKADI